MTRNDFFESVKSGKIENIYLFTGPEEWIKNEALTALRAALLPAGLEQLNDLTLEGAAADQIIDAAETVPIMCEKRMVVVRDWAPMMPGKSKNEDAEVDRIQKWLEHPAPSCTVIFYMRTDPDGRKKATTAIKKKAAQVQFDSLSDAELARWCKKRLSPMGKNMSVQAVNTLSFMAGRDLIRLDGELNKLAAYVEDRKEISVDDVKAIVPASLEYNIFELINLLLEGNPGKAQQMVNSLLRNGQTPIGILAMITRQLRQLTHMRLALDAGETVQSVQDLLKLHPYAARQLSRQCKRLPAQTLKSLYELCVETDFEIKSGRMRDSAALAAIIRIISSTRTAAR